MLLNQGCCWKFSRPGEGREELSVQISVLIIWSVSCLCQCRALSAGCILYRYNKSKLVIKSIFKSEVFIFLLSVLSHLLPCCLPPCCSSSAPFLPSLPVSSYWKQGSVWAVATVVLLLPPFHRLGPTLPGSERSTSIKKPKALGGIFHYTVVRQQRGGGALMSLAGVCECISSHVTCC